MQVRKTKKFNFIYKKLISALIAAVFSAAFCVYAADTSKWTLAAEKFSFTQSKTSASSLAVSKALPQLVLEQMAQNLTRMPRAQEQLDRKLYDLRKTRLDLFLQLSKAVQTRDSLVLGNYSQKVLDSKLKAEDKKISDLEQKISENLNETEKIKKEYEPLLKMEEIRKEKLEKGHIEDDDSQKVNMANFFKAFIPGKKEEFKLEDVVLYQNDYTKLFDAGENNRAEGYASYGFEKACVDAKINGLITGQITMYGSYVSVAVTLYLFPGAKAAAHAIEVGSIDELKSISVSLASQLTPKIADSMPVELNFSVSPEEAVEDVIITVDDIVYRGIPEKLMVQAGVHTLSVSSKGFSTLSTSFGFTGAREFNVSINMEKNNPGQVNLYLKNPVEGNIFENGIYASSVDSINRASEITINNRNVLGHFVGVDGKTADFIVYSRNFQLEKELFVNAKIFDKSKNIDTRRRWMYGAYSGLICSLIPYFICLGNTNSLGNYVSSQSSQVSEQTLSQYQTWNTFSNISMGVSIGAGVFFVAELVRYLYAANQVLPVEAKPVTAKQKELIEKQIQLAREKTETEAAGENLEKTAEDEKINSPDAEKSEIIVE